MGLDVAMPIICWDVILPEEDFIVGNSGLGAGASSLSAGPSRSFVGGREQLLNGTGRTGLFSRTYICGGTTGTFVSSSFKPKLLFFRTHTDSAGLL